jgi:formiminotetrahydrofolate cyclodeaminase
MVASVSGGDPSRARELRADALRLAADDARAYEAFTRDQTHETWGAIVGIPLEIAAVAREVTALARTLAAQGKVSVRADADAAAVLAEAAAQVATRLARVNRRT